MLGDEDRPKWLEVHDDIYPPGDKYAPSRRPNQCSGPRRPGKPCGRHNFCCWCHERRARSEAIKAAMIHIGQPNIHRISIPLDFAGIHPMHARNALRLVSRVLRRHNFTRISLWLHPFNENPFDGIRSHIEGIVSGLDADPDILDPTRPGGLGLTLKRMREEAGDSAKPIKIHSEQLHPHSRKHVDDLVRHGIECGRPSWPVRRIHAGLYQDKRKQTRCRLTNVRDGGTPTHLIDYAVKTDDHLPDPKKDDILAWALMAEYWRSSVGRPVITRNVQVAPGFVDLVERATTWREEYKLPSNEELEQQYAAPLVAIAT